MQLPPERVEAQRARTKDVDQAPIQTTLFGSVTPKPIDISRFPQLMEALRWLNRQKTKIASVFSDAEKDYEIGACEGELACVDAEGRVFIGEKLLARVASDPELVAGVLAHEIGHRPKTWKRHNKAARDMNRAQLAALARDEEGKADYNAGRALAALQMSADPLCAYLQAHGHFEKQPENYHSVDVRIATIRAGYASQAARRATSKKLFGGFHSPPDPKDLIADGKGKR
jgi:hypothetical protein